MPNGTEISIDFYQTAGAKTALLPTGNVKDKVQVTGEVNCCVHSNAANPWFCQSERSGHEWN